MSVREHWINVRVNPEELARIREKQKELGIRNTGAYMRKMAMDGYCVNLDLFGCGAGIHSSSPMQQQPEPVRKTSQ